jgi:hypothetical protein
MRERLQAPDRRKVSWPHATANRERKITARRPRFGRATIGFWLGGSLLGTGGCILGASMPYHHPVALVISALWWGIYLGCFGASVGALGAILTERPRGPRSGSQEKCDNSLPIPQAAKIYWISPADEQPGILEERRVRPPRRGECDGAGVRVDLPEPSPEKTFPPLHR